MRLGTSARSRWSRLFATAALKSHESALERRRQRLAIHIAEHQQPPRRAILHGGGQQALHLVPGERVELAQAQWRISIPHPARNSFRSAMAISRSWNTLAASAPLAPAAKTSQKCSAAPAPPDAMTGTVTAPITSAVWSAS